ncbi:MAG: T9SS type A sorting domain-containing protein [Bacteroidia bacterium]|nr:T9SS type A sorting domain-containing protein [Bacteroidia bacterium]
MKNFITFVITFFFLLSLHAQKTFISNGNSADWTSTAAWTMENGTPATTIPGENDHIIIKNYISLELAQTYVHYGNINVMGNGLLQIRSAEKGNGGFVFGGREMNVYGFLFSSSNFSQVKMRNGKKGLIILHETATMNYSANFSLLGGLILESSACGATVIEGDLILQNEEAFICGEGNIMVGGKLRVFGNEGQEFGEVLTEDIFSKNSCEQIRIHKNTENCDANTNAVAGLAQHFDFIGIENMQVEERATGVTITWESVASTLTKTFTVERSIDGRIFEAIASIENVETELFEVLDQQPVQVKSYYRIRQTLNSGHPVYSDVKVYDPRAEIMETTQVNLFPNNITSGETIHIETSRVEDVYNATVELRTLSGQTLKTELVPVSSNGKIYKDMQVNQNPGMYLLILRVGQEVITKKIQLR